MVCLSLDHSSQNARTFLPCSLVSLAPRSNALHLFGAQQILGEQIVKWTIERSSKRKKIIYSPSIQTPLLVFWYFFISKVINLLGSLLDRSRGTALKMHICTNSQNLTCHFTRILNPAPPNLILVSIPLHTVVLAQCKTHHIFVVWLLNNGSYFYLLWLHVKLIVFPYLITNCMFSFINHSSPLSLLHELFD